MTREDFIAAVETLGSAVDMARYLEQLDEIFTCYDEQRAEIERLQAQLATANRDLEELMDNLESCKGNELAAQNEILQQELDQFRRADKKQLFNVATEQQKEAL